MRSVNQALDRVAIIVDEKYDWLLVEADDRGEFLSVILHGGPLYD
jgi:hypothetical protein